MIAMIEEREKQLKRGYKEVLLTDWGRLFRVQGRKNILWSLNAYLLIQK